MYSEWTILEHMAIMRGTCNRKREIVAGGRVISQHCPGEDKRDTEKRTNLSFLLAYKHLEQRLWCY